MSSLLKPAEAHRALRHAEDRDEVFSVLLRGLRHWTSFAGLFDIEGNTAKGRLAIYRDELTRDGIGSVEVPLASAHAFRQVVDTAAPYVGTIATSDEALNERLVYMCAFTPPALPQSALLLPICVERRVVAIALSFRTDRALTEADSHEIAPLASAAEVGLTRVLMTAAGIERPREAGAAQSSGAGLGPDPLESLDALADRLEREQQWEPLVAVMLRQLYAVPSPAQAVPLYKRLARILTDELRRASDAIAIWTNLCKLTPPDLDAFMALLELYREARAWSELSNTLNHFIATAQAHGQLGQHEVVALHAEVGRVETDKLGRPEQAIAAWQRVLETDPDNAEAYAALRQLYASQGNWRAGADLLLNRAHRAPQPEALEPLLEAAGILQTKVADAEAAATAYEAARRIDPKNAVAQKGLRELYGTLEKWELLAELLLEQSEQRADLNERTSLLCQAASIYEHKLSRPADALTAMRTALRLDASKASIASEFERLATATGDWDVLMEESARRARTLEASDRLAACELWVEMSGRYQEELGDTDRAIKALRTALTFDRENRDAEAALAALLRKVGDWRELLERQRNQLAKAESPEEALELCLSIGDILETELQDDTQAIVAYQEALERDPTCMLAMVSLERLYRRGENWKELVEILERTAKLRASDDDRAEQARTRLEIAQLWHGRLGVKDRAIEAYREVLELEPKEPSALEALEELYEQTGEAESYMEVLEAQLDDETDDEERVERYARLAAAWREEFARPDRAISCLEKLLAIEPDHPEHLRELVRLYRAARDWEALLRTYRGLLPYVTDASEKAEIYLAMAELQERRLKQPRKAIACLQEMLDADLDPSRALELMAKLYEEAGEWERALDMLTRLAETPEAAPDRCGLYYRIGQLARAKLEDRERAESAFLQALSADEHYLAAMEALSRLYADAEDWQKAADMLVRRAAETEDSRARARLHIDAGRLYSSKLDQPQRAREQFAAVLELDPDNVDAAAPLAEFYAREEEWSQLSPLLDVLLRGAKAQGWGRDERADLTRRAAKCAEELGDRDKAVRLHAAVHALDAADTSALSRSADLHYEMEQWDAAAEDYGRLLQELPETDARLEQACLRLGEIQLRRDQPRKALDTFNRCLAVSPGNRDALRAIVEIHEKEGDHAAVILAKRALLPGVSEDEQASLLHDIGDIYRRELDNLKKATAAYEEALELAPENRQLLQKALDCYSESKQWRKAIEMIERFIDLEQDPVRRATYHQAAGTIYRVELEDSAAALECYERALDSFFEDEERLSEKLLARALEAFRWIDSTLREAAEWKNLERAYRRMLKRVHPRENEALADLWTALGELYQTQLEQPEAAIQAYELAYNLDPENPARSAALVDVCGVAGPEHLKAATAEIEKLLRADPHDYESYGTLYRLCRDNDEPDRAWSAAAALVFFERADSEQRAYFDEHRPRGFVEAKRGLNDSLWRRLQHPDEDRNVSAAFAAIWQGVALVGARPHKAFQLKRKERAKPDKDDRPVVKILSHLSQALAVPRPDLYVQPSQPGELMLANALDGRKLAPALVIRRNLVEREERDIAFRAAETLALLRPERYLKLALATRAELKAALFAALVLARPKTPVPAELASHVKTYVREIESHIEPNAREQLGELAARLLDKDARPDLKKWSGGAAATSHRVGLLMCGDLPTATRLLASEPPLVGGPTAKELTLDLVLFSVSEDFAELRKKLGLALD